MQPDRPPVEDRPSGAAPGGPHRRARPPALTAQVGELLGRGDGTGLDTSGGLLFNHTLWARDRVVTAFDLLDVEPRPARETVLGRGAPPPPPRAPPRHVLSEEEPGRIHNERRDLRTWQAPLWLKTVFGLGLAPLWGGTPRGYTTYFASDSTPLFVMLAAALARREPGVLATPVTRRDGQTVSLGDCVVAACAWVEGHLNADGLVEATQSNPLALQQGWKDGPTSNFDERGRMANLLQPMAYLDVQVLAAEALARAADLGLDSSERLRGSARAIRDATIARFWLPERRYFGCAIDRDRRGHPRLLRAVQSNAGWMLATSFFDDLPEPLRQSLVGGIVRMLFSAELLTPAGVRGRALSDHNRRFRNYHENVWPVDTAAIARGLRRQGLDELAAELEARLLDTANMLGGTFEFLAVDHEGRVVDPRLTAESAARLFGGPVAGLPSEMVPDEPMGWTATALLAIKRGRTARARAGRAVAERLAARPAWLTELTRDVLSSIAPVEVCATRVELEERYVALAPTYLDHARGLRRSAATVLVQGFGGVIPREAARRAREAARGASARAARAAPGGAARTRG
jgi:hypothetical protein